ncbi:MAG: GtrA family protein [Patescibacteria group bacterium]
MKKTDVILALITGEGVAWLFIWLIKNSPNFSLPVLDWILPVLFPILAVLGIWIAYLLGKRFLFVYQLAKFLLIGAAFAIFDLIILNILMEEFGISKDGGLKYSLFVTVSFIIATSVKYVADKYWAFEKKESAMGSEFLKFFLITVVSGVIQVGVASLAFKLLSSVGMTDIVLGNIGKILGIIVASAFNFVCYKFIVFKK